MKTVIKYLFVFAFSLGSIYIANAQKFGYVNTQQLIQDIPEVEEANANLENYQAQFQKKGQDMIRSLQAKYEALEQKRVSGEISPKQLEVQAEELKKEELKIAEYEKEGQKRMMDKSEALLKPLREKIQAAIAEVANENGYDYIFDFSLGVLLYADSSTDVSALVKSKLQ